LWLCVVKYLANSTTINRKFKYFRDIQGLGSFSRTFQDHENATVKFKDFLQGPLNPAAKLLSAFKWACDKLT